MAAGEPVCSRSWAGFPRVFWKACAPASTPPPSTQPSRGSSALPSGSPRLSEGLGHRRCWLSDGPLNLSLLHLPEAGCSDRHPGWLQPCHVLGCSPSGRGARGPVGRPPPRTTAQALAKPQPDRSAPPSTVRRRGSRSKAGNDTQTALGCRLAGFTGRTLIRGVYGAFGAGLVSARDTQPASVLNRGPRLYRPPADYSRLHGGRRPPSPMPPEHDEARPHARASVHEGALRRARDDTPRRRPRPRVFYLTLLCGAAYTGAAVGSVRER